MPTATPLLLLDVDGVVNALDEVAARDTWPDLRRGSASALGSRWPILYAPFVLQTLGGWHRDGLVELQWLTTWGCAANGELRLLLGLPELAVAGTYADEPSRPDDRAPLPETDAAAGATAARGAGGPSPALAAVTPSAPARSTERWWKFDAVRRLHAEDPARVLVWVDDELHVPGSRYLAWARDSGTVLAVGPHPACGLTAEDLAGVRDWLAAR